MSNAQIDHQLKALDDITADLGLITQEGRAVISKSKEFIQLANALEKRLGRMRQQVLLLLAGTALIAVVACFFMYSLVMDIRHVLKDQNEIHTAIRDNSSEYRKVQSALEKLHASESILLNHIELLTDDVTILKMRDIQLNRGKKK